MAVPERRPEGQDASEVLFGAYHPLSLCARLVLCINGLLELDLAMRGRQCARAFCRAQPSLPGAGWGEANGTRPMAKQDTAGWDPAIPTRLHGEFSRCEES